MDIQANRKLWTAALRSGDFEQGQSVLCRGKHHCCLGVACEVYQKHVGGLTTHTDEDDCTIYDNNSAFLPKKVQEWLNISASGLLVSPAKGEFPSLTDCNDRGKMDFAMIADLIDTQEFAPPLPVAD